MGTATVFTLETPDATSLFVYRWLPAKPVKAVVQIAHGWAEHAGRYARVAEALCREGRISPCRAAWSPSRQVLG